MRFQGKASLCLLLWLAGVGTLSAQPAPRDTLPGPEPVMPGEVGADTLASGRATISLPEPLPPIPGVPALGNERVLSRRRILELASGSLGEALFVTPGVHLMRTGWHGLPQAVSVRGAEAGEVLYLLDGMPLSDDRLGVVNVNSLPLTGVEVCEIAKGGLSSVYGSGAGAGVLGLRSMTAMSEFPESEVGVWWGSFDASAVSLRFNRRITERVGVLSAYDNLESGGWTEGSAAESDRLLGKVTALVGRATRIDLAGYRYRGDFERPDSCPGVSTTHRADRENDRSLIGVSVLSGERRRLRINCYRLGISDTYSSAGTTYVHDGLSQGVELGLSWPGPDSAGTWLKAGVETRRLESSSLGERTSTDFYGQALKELRWKRSSIQGSMRLAKTSGFDMEVAAGLAARFTPREDMLLFLRLSRDYRFPGFDVLYNRGSGHPADPRVGAERSWNLELGTTFEKGPVSASASVFGRHADGLALRLSDGSCIVGLDPDAEFEAAGLEASVGWGIRPWFGAEVSYSAIRARDGDGERPAYIPEQVVALSASAGKRLSRHISAGVTLAGRYVTPVGVGAVLEACAVDAACLEDAELPGYISALLNVHIDIDRVTTYLRIQNLASDGIQTEWGRPGLPSRSYEFGTSWRLLD